MFGGKIFEILKKGDDVQVYAKNLVPRCSVFVVLRLWLSLR